jgi:hypothetical protein
LLFGLVVRCPAEPPASARSEFGTGHQSDPFGNPGHSVNPAKR